MRSTARRLLSTVSASSHRDIAIVSGASRGIGLQLLHQILQHSTNINVIALSRHCGDQLSQLIQSHPGRLEWISMDLQDQSSIISATDAINQRYDKVNYIMNVAGLLGDQSKPERSVSSIDYDWMQKSFNVRKIIPLNNRFV
jgi:NADP-dependent 3-hydroxy acid dehydrogenase YdfG